MDAFFCFVRCGMKLYVNGVLVVTDFTEETFSPPSNSRDTSLYIGKRMDGNSFLLDGYVDEVFMWETTVEDYVINQIYIKAA